MEVTPLLPEGRQVVHAYREGGFVIGGEPREGAVLVLPARTMAWPVTRFEEIDEASLEQLHAADDVVDVLILGTGKQFRMIDPRLRQALRKRGIVVECMATPAACRTFNVLLVEDRKVAAALLPVV
ncbi:MAG TPA: Mth938-like domain-containing protein [Geminicoccus sp.]|jgi:uncharacterized protein|uniref:Mth938-like domain-containing protein n=1 Tax=Geminicoccus sp. TaxID=2024832 RepID=UPI002E36851F|nr:Mth938-like domain-containing protein [Geminicoccus sp.]HEX2529189.1 Mth938-like domain-containing protein [Geminicoccus sp.]